MQRISAVIRTSKKIVFVDFTADFYVYSTNFLPFYCLVLSSTNADWNLWAVPEKIKEKMERWTESEHPCCQWRLSELGEPIVTGCETQKDVCPDVNEYGYRIRTRIRYRRAKPL